VIQGGEILWKSADLSHKRLAEQDLLASFFMPVSYVTYSSTLKMEATSYSETPFDFQPNTRRYVLEGRTISSFCENLTSTMSGTCFVQNPLYLGTGIAP
jgi:hypothetical protein